MSEREAVLTALARKIGALSNDICGKLTNGVEVDADQWGEWGNLAQTCMAADMMSTPLLAAAVGREWLETESVETVALAPHPIDSRGGVEGNPAIVQPAPDELDEEMRGWQEQSRHALARLDEWLDRDIPDEDSAE